MLFRSDENIYENAGTSTLRGYIDLAISAGLVTATEPDMFGEYWIELIADTIPSKLQPEAVDVPEIYVPLLTLLELFPSTSGRMPFSECGTLVRDNYPDLYRQAGVQRLKEYINKAEEMGLVRTGGIEPRRWVEAVRRH